MKLANYILACITFVSLDYFFQAIFLRQFCWYWLVIFAIVFFVQVIAIIYNLNKNHDKQYLGTQYGSFVHLSSDFLLRNWLSANNVLDWAKDNKLSKEDLFDFTLKARRIADRLLKSIDANESVSIGLLGQYGSGKSVITELVESIIVVEKNGRTLFSSVLTAGDLMTPNRYRNILLKRS